MSGRGYSRTNRHRPPSQQWFNTLAGLMVLLTTLFAMLFSISQIEPGKFAQLLGSLQDAFGMQKTPLTLIHSSKGDITDILKFEQAVTLVRLKEKLELPLYTAGGPYSGQAPTTSFRMCLQHAKKIPGFLRVDACSGTDSPPLEPQESGLRGKEAMESANEREDYEITEEGFLLRISTDALFVPASLAVLRPKIQAPLREMANFLADMPNMVRVIGHTDDQPLALGIALPNHLSLSAVYAASVVDFFITEGKMNPRQLQTRGLGSYAPLENNDSDHGRFHNRRIEILVLRQTVPADQAEPKEKAPPEKAGQTHPENPFKENNE